MINRWFYSVCALCLCGAALSVARADDAQISVDRVYESRTAPDEFDQNRLLVSVRVKAANLANARALRGVATSVIDASGGQLVDDKKYFNKWQVRDPMPNTAQSAELKKLAEQAGLAREGASVGLELNASARGAQTLREIVGYVEAYYPERDASAVVTVENIGAQDGQTLDNATLQRAGLRINFLTKNQVERYQKTLSADAQADANLSEQERAKRELAKKLVEAMRQMFGSSLVEGDSFNPNKIVMNVDDPRVRLVNIELETAQGQPIKRKGYFGTRISSDTTYTRTYEFETPVPPDARLKMYVATPQSVTQIPFRLADVPLP